jgi:hypothetical protein
MFDISNVCHNDYRVALKNEAGVAIIGQYGADETSAVSAFIELVCEGKDGACLYNGNDIVLNAKNDAVYIQGEK